MAAKVLIPTALRQYVGLQDTLEVRGATIGDAMRELGERFPALQRHLFNESGHVRSFVNIFVGDEDIRQRQREATPLRDDDVITIVPSIAGGVLAEEAPAGVSLDQNEIARYSR